jgi:hypothetical protein
MKDWNVSRRDLLKSLGVGAACLPLLHAERAFGQSVARKGLFVVACGEGYRPGWIPAPGSLMNQKLPDTISPLEDVKGDVVLLPGMTNPAYTGCARCGHGAYGTMYYGGPATAKSGEYKEPGLPGPDGFTVDQTVAAAFKTRYPDQKLPTLPLQVQIDTYLADGTTGAHRCFWAGAGQPVTPFIDPYKVYSMLFAGSAPTPAGPDPNVMRLLAQKRSILDFVGKDLERYGVRLGTDAQQTIRQHLTSIRDIENSLSGSSSGSSGPVMVTGDFKTMLDPLDNKNYAAITNLQMMLGVMALASGTTQVVTLQLVDATGDAKSFNFIEGVPGNPANTKRNNQDLHGLAHNPMQGGIDAKQRVDKWFMSQFAVLIRAMKSVNQGGKTLLDNSLILWGNHMESGDNHGAQAVPWLLAGSAGGYFKTGVNASAVCTGKPINGVLAEICNAMGIAKASYGTAEFGQAMAGLKA